MQPLYLDVITDRVLWIRHCLILVCMNSTKDLRSCIHHFRELNSTVFISGLLFLVRHEDATRVYRLVEESSSDRQSGLTGTHFQLSWPTVSFNVHLIQKAHNRESVQSEKIIYSPDYSIQKIIDLCHNKKRGIFWD